MLQLDKKRESLILTIRIQEDFTEELVLEGKVEFQEAREERSKEHPRQRK